MAKHYFTVTEIINVNGKPQTNPLRDPLLFSVEFDEDGTPLPYSEGCVLDAAYELVNKFYPKDYYGFEINHLDKWHRQYYFNKV